MKNMRLKLAAQQTQAARPSAASGANVAEAGKAAGAAQKAGVAFKQAAKSNDSLAASVDRVAARFKAAGEIMVSIGTKVAAVGLVIKAGLGVAVATFASMGDEMEKASERTGVAVERLSELKAVAELAGMDFQTLQTDVRNMQVSIVKMAEGSGDAAESFAALGLSLDDLRGLTADKQILKIADAFTKLTDPTVRAGLASEIFGKKTGIAMLPLLEKGAAGIGEFTKQMRDLGITMSSSDAKAAEELANTWTVLGDVMKSLTFTVGAALAPSFKTLAGYLTAGISIVKQYIDVHRDLVVKVSAVATGIIAVGATIAGLGLVMQGIGAAITIAVSAAGVAATVFGALTSPVLLLAAGALALGGYMIYAATRSGSAFTTIKGAAADAAGYMANAFSVVGAYLTRVFQKLSDDATLAFGGVKDALSGGNWALAAQIVWTALRVEWLRGIAGLHDAWVGVKGWFGAVWADAVAGVSTLWYDAVAGIQRSMVSMGAVVKDTWANTIAAINGTFAGLRKTINDAIAYANSLLPGHTDADYKIDLKHNAADYLSTMAHIKAGEAASVGGNNAARDAQLQTIETELRAKLAAVDAARERAKAAGVNPVDQADSAILQRRIESLLAERAKLLKEANAKARPFAFGLKLPDFKMPSPDDFDRLMKRTINVSGTFNPNGVYGIAGGTAAERTAKATEESAGRLKNIDKLLGKGKTLAFS